MSTFTIAQEASFNRLLFLRGLISEQEFRTLLDSQLNEALVFAERYVQELHAIQKLLHKESK